MLLPFTAISERRFKCNTLQKLHANLRRTDHEWRAAQSQGADYEGVRALCKLHIKASYQYQRARWGRIRVRLNTAGLMR